MTYPAPVGFDHIANYKPYEGWGYSQLGEGGANAVDNCGPACFSDVLAAYYKFHTKPQWWTDNEYSTTYHGGEDFGHLIDWMRKNPEDFPNPPAVSVANPNDTISAIDAAGRSGFATVVLCHCNSQAQLQNHQTGIYHFVIVERLTPTSITVLNPWHGVEDTFDLGFFRLATAGTLAGTMAIFQRPLPGTAPAPTPQPAPPAPVVPPAPPSPPAPPQPTVAQLQAALEAAKATVATQQAQLAAADVALANSKAAIDKLAALQAWLATMPK